MKRTSTRCTCTRPNLHTHTHNTHTRAHAHARTHSCAFLHACTCSAVEELDVERGTAAGHTLRRTSLGTPSRALPSAARFHSRCGTSQQHTPCMSAYTTCNTIEALPPAARFDPRCTVQLTAQLGWGLHITGCTQYYAPECCSARIHSGPLRPNTVGAAHYRLHSVLLC